MGGETIQLGHIHAPKVHFPTTASTLLDFFLFVCTQTNTTKIPLNPKLYKKSYKNEAVFTK